CRTVQYFQAQHFAPLGHFAPGQLGDQRKKGTVCRILPQHHHLGRFAQLDTNLKEMTMKLTKELPLIGIVLLPFLYLAYIWNQLPEQVPLHYNIKGEVDRYGDKSELIMIPIMLPLLIYVIFLVVPYIDPKKQLHKMGNKYYTLILLLTVFMSILALIILYTAKNQSWSNPNYILLMMGVLFIILGNYFKTIKANYFIGIRTPWTLESEAVWKDTNK